ncbi:NADH-ubiquinone oxidoreductase-F iron-sulfur binding region domain-containing protein [Halomarina litorea]|uniref:NADH-ubiquinone oxidoreductase-F iron-sulfur binding region domain-containing protein n=1 Tax=Halomarina litorea TaxID=2961595 RepID=UPI0020C363B7|nr:NADH-ubiquinone oxidoreductase-F iron-sulfur binding region domain-containing protein [Halomarina sp. BCD28]
MTHDPPTPPTVRVSGGETARTRAVLSAAREAATDATVLSTGPTGLAALTPLVALTDEAWTAYLADPTPEATADAVASLESGDRPADAHAVVPHEDPPTVLPAPDEGPLSVGRRRVLARCGWTDPTAPTTEASADADPDETLARASDLGLLGRGRGDASTDRPVATDWETAHETDGESVVVVNAAEADPHADADRTLLAGVPGEVLDGALAVAGAVGAEECVVAVNEAHETATRRVEDAVAALDVDGRVQVVSTPDEYTVGEPTMTLESLEGADRIEARRSPPGPATYGLHGQPTVVHTPRTLAQVREALLRPESFDADDADPGTRLVTVAGDVAAPATVELPTSGSLDTALDAVDPTGRPRAYCVGGRFGGLTRSLDVLPSAPALAGARFGTNGVVELLDDTRCVVAFAGRRSRFAQETNCGRCGPCREGSKQLTELLRDVYDGDYQTDMLRELTRVMRRTSLCGFGRDASRPVTTGMDEFDGEFRAHAEGRCPSGACGSGANHDREATIRRGEEA